MSRLTLLIVPIIALLVSAPARAVVMLDQHFEDTDASAVGYGVYPSLSPAQTFTVGLEGILTRVEVTIRVDFALPGDELTLRLRPTVAGVPDDSTLLTSATVSVLAGYQDVAFDLSAAGIMVIPGEILALQLVSSKLDIPGGIVSILWQGEFVNATYPGGNAFSHGEPAGPYIGATTDDLFFKTFVETSASAVPEPTTSSLALLGLGALALAARRRRKKDRRSNRTRCLLRQRITG